MGVNLIKNNKKDVIFNNKNILKILLIIVIALVIRFKTQRIILGYKI